jgi:hypothetical protein
MTVTIDLKPELEESLMALARERGLSLQQYLLEIVARAAGSSQESPASTKAGNLSDLLLNSPFAEANLDLRRVQDYPRPPEIE